MLDKILTSNGQKDYQRNDNVDRALNYRKWLRKQDTNGFFIDVDFIKWKVVNGVYTPVAITELTKIDGLDEPNEKYLKAIEERFFSRDKQGKIIQELSKRLNIPAYLILFCDEFYWFWVFSFRKHMWKFMTVGGFLEFIRSL